MKEVDEPMNLSDIETLLIEAARISNNRQFVIAGSLSCIASAMILPKRMMMSRDIDLYTKEDPERVFFEIGQELTEGSKFHEMNGFFADAISPNILSLPEGWESRLTPITLQGGVVAWFVNSNDTACGKLIRGNANDIEWLREGIKERILNPKLIANRLPHCMNTLEGEVERARALLDEIESNLEAAKRSAHAKP